MAIRNFLVLFSLIIFPFGAQAELTVEELLPLVQSRTPQVTVVGSKVYVAIPARTLAKDGHAQEAFSAAQKFGRMILQEWMVKLLTLESNQEMASLVGNLSDEELGQALMETASDDDSIDLMLEGAAEQPQLPTQKLPRIPTPEEVIARAKTTREVIEKVEELQKIEIDMQKIAEAFNQKLIFERPNEESGVLQNASRLVSDVLRHDGYLMTLGVKVPESYLKDVENWKFLPAPFNKMLARFLLGSVNLTTFLIPWRIEVYDLHSKNLIQTEWLMQARTRLWVHHDFGRLRKSHPDNVVVRVGAGLFSGNHADDSSWGGASAGFSWDIRNIFNTPGWMNFKSNLKAGWFVGQRGGYAIYSWQNKSDFALAPEGKVRLKGNGGYFFTLAEVNKLFRSNDKSALGRRFADSKRAPQNAAAEARVTP